MGALSLHPHYSTSPLCCVGVSLCFNHVFSLFFLSHHSRSGVNHVSPLDWVLPVSPFVPQCVFVFVRARAVHVCGCVPRGLDCAMTQHGVERSRTVIMADPSGTSTTTQSIHPHSEPLPSIRPPCLPSVLALSSVRQ